MPSLRQIRQVCDFSGSPSLVDLEVTLSRRSAAVGSKARLVITSGGEEEGVTSAAMAPASGGKPSIFAREGRSFGAYLRSVEALRVEVRRYHWIAARLIRLLAIW